LAACEGESAVAEFEQVARHIEQPLDLFDVLAIVGPKLEPLRGVLGQLGGLGRRQRLGQEGIAEMDGLADLNALACALGLICRPVDAFVYDLQQCEDEMVGHSEMG
jgi:hypothetical protein